MVIIFHFCWIPLKSKYIRFTPMYANISGYIHPFFVTWIRLASHEIRCLWLVSIPTIPSSLLTKQWNLTKITLNLIEIPLKILHPFEATQCHQVLQPFRRMAGPFGHCRIEATGSSGFQSAAYGGTVQVDGWYPSTVSTVIWSETLYFI